MAGVYRRCIPYFCFYVMICLVVGENDNDDRRQEDAHSETNTITITNVNTDVSVSEGIYTSTSENPNSEMMNSAALKKDTGFLMYTSLSMSSKSRPRNAIPDQGKKRDLIGLSGQDNEDQRQSTPGAWEETSQTDNVEDIQQRGGHEDIQQRGNPEEAGQRHTIEDIQQRGNPEETGQRRTPEDIQQRGNPEETGQRHTAEDTQQRSNLTENEVSPNKTMQEINDSLNAVNKTLVGSDMLIVEGRVVVTTLQTTEGYTRLRKPPRPIQPLHGQADIHAEKMESRANPCSRPMVFVCLLCLCGWLF